MQKWWGRRFRLFSSNSLPQFYCEWLCVCVRFFCPSKPYFVEEFLTFWNRIHSNKSHWNFRNVLFSANNFFFVKNFQLFKVEKQTWSWMEMRLMIDDKHPHTSNLSMHSITRLHFLSALSWCFSSQIVNCTHGSSE